MYFFVNLRVHLKISTRDRKLWGNRVEPCHFPTSKNISIYLMEEVYIFTFPINHPSLREIDVMVSDTMQLHAHRADAPLQEEWEPKSNILTFN